MSDIETSVTIKYPEAKRYEGAPWAVFKGSTSMIRDQIVGYFGFDQQHVAGMTLHELVLMANDAVRSAGKIQADLGGTVIPQSQPQQQQQQSSPEGGSVWDKLDGEAGGEQRVEKPAEKPNEGLIALLSEAATVDDLKRLWATNKAAFEDPAVQEAYSTRGKALKAAASN